MEDASGDAEELVRSYYRAIDGEGEEGLEALLAPDFVQERSDRTFEGREAFVRFMREERPDPDTTHDIDAVYEGRGGVAVTGTVHRTDGRAWFDFVDVFDIDQSAIRRIRTFTS
jgi:ketosteroid isomerase-like protein